MFPAMIIMAQTSGTVRKTLFNAVFYKKIVMIMESLHSSRLRRGTSVYSKNRKTGVDVD